jgi:flagellar biosynthesis protein FlhB
MSTKGTKIDKREDVSPASGEEKYGDVEFADATNNKYPIDTPEHVRAAWRYINQKDNAAKYDAGEVETIKGRIKRAAKKHDIEINED